MPTLGGLWVVLGVLAQAGAPPVATEPAAQAPTEPAAQTPAGEQVPGTPAEVPGTPGEQAPQTADPAAQMPAGAAAVPAAAPSIDPTPAGPVSQEGARPEEAADPWARPFFVKGDLNTFSVRPGTRRNFIGVAGGISALPSSADAIINAFYLTIEPIVEINNPKYHWKLSLGAPLQFELADTRGAFEVCVGEAQTLHKMGQSQDMIATATATCVSKQKDRAIGNLGRLRRADWDEASDFAKIIRHLVVGGQEQPFYMSLSRLYDQSFGHGTAVRHYNPNIDYNTARLGANIDLSRSAIGVQAMANDLVNPDVLGMLGFVRPFRPYSDNVYLRSLSVGASWVHGANQPTGLKYERSLFGSTFEQPIPALSADSDHRLAALAYRPLTIIGFDVETKVVRRDWADVKVYADFDKMLNYDSGFTLGSLFRLSFGRPATQALRARAEVSFFGPAFMPNYFDAFHDIFQYQYLPAGYKTTNGNTYYPTKLEFMEASRGGRRRIGGYFEVTHAIFDALTVGATVRGHTAYGIPTSPGFTGLAFPDYSPTCTDGADGKLTCSQKISMNGEPGFGSLRLSAELPFRRFLQGYASYEAFSSTTDGGLGAFKLDGDNEVFFSGLRIMLLPILFIQAEARRYFFLQRLSHVDVHQLTFQQDQNLHSLWTFAVNLSLGYEF